MRNYFSKLGTQVPWRTSQSRGATLALPLRYLSALLILLTLSIGQSWAAYYTPTADEVIKLQADAYKSDGTNYSKHAAVAWAGNPSFSDKKAGNPDNAGALTSSNVKTCSVKGNGGAKNLTISITGCSKIIVYHEKHSSRYVELRSGSKAGTLIGSGSANTSYSEIVLDGSTSYDLFLHGTTGSDDQDFYVYAVKLIKAASGDPVAVTGISLAPSSATIKVGKKVTLVPTITPSNATDKDVTWSVTSGSTYASVSSAGVVTGLAAGTAVVTATAHDGSGVTQTASITVEECPTSGTLFSMIVTDPDGTVYTDVTDAAPQLIGATYTGGKAYATSTSSSKRSPKITGDEFDFNVGSGGSVAVKVELDCALAEGDIISFTSTHDKNFYVRKVVGTDLHTTSSLSLKIPSGSALIGEDVFYVMRTNSACSFSEINIIRPIYRTITLEYADGETADGSLEVIDGTAATKPADPTWTHHRFAGWYNGASPYDWTANVTGNLTLTAHWTQLYSVTYAKGEESATGTAPTQDELAAGEKFTVAANTFAFAGHDFSTWNDGANNFDPGMEYTMGSANVTLTAQWVTAATKYAITKGSHANGDFTISPAEQAEGQKVTLVVTPDEDYVFDAWEIVKTEDASATGILVDDNGQFEMPAYAVTVNATFAADPRQKVLYVTSTAEETAKANDKLYAALKDIYNVKIVGPTSDADQSAYALVVLHESVGGGDYNKTAIAAAKVGNTPVLNTKSYFYNSDRFGWGTPNAGQSVKGATLNSAYCNIEDHPLFDGVTVSAGFVEITDDAAAKCMQPIGSFVEGKEGYILATAPNADSGDGAAIHELTPTQRGASAGKYLMISVSNAKLDALNANGQKLFQNAAAYLIGSTSWDPIAVPTAAVIEAAPTAAYSVGDNIALSALAAGVSATTTYTWYKGDSWAAAETAGAIQAAKTAAEGGDSYGITDCALGDAGIYWCVISNGTDCEAKASLEVTVVDASYNISFSSAHGTAPTATTGVSYTLPTLSASGFQHQGWTASVNVFVDAEEVTAGTLIANGKMAVFGADVTFTAVWAQEFQVTFNGNGHGTPIAAQIVVNGELATEPAAPFEIGYDFGGWFTDAECTAGNEFDFATPITATTPLYAKWTEFAGCVELWPATSGTAPEAVGNAINMQTGSKGATMTALDKVSNLTYTTNGLQFGSTSGVKVNVVLNNDMTVGTKITMTLVAGGTGTRGLLLYTKTGAKINDFTCWVDGTNPASNGAEDTFTYTVVADDGLDGTNEFQLWRNNTVILKSLKVESCGSAVVFHNLTSAVSPAGMGTITLGASSVREGYTTTAEYSAIDAAYEFDEWQISGTDATIDDAHANPVTITMGTVDAVVTLKLKVATVKYTVTFDAQGGSTVDPQQVADGASPVVPTAPTKEDYIFRGWAESAGASVSDVVDVTSFTISAAKTFYAVWEAEPAGIKLFDGEGNLNTTNFISPAKTTIEIDAVEYPCLEQFASNRTSLGGATPADMVMYNATTDEAKIKMTFYNNNSGVKKAILYKYEEGAEAPEKIEIEVPGQTIYTTDYYTFNSSKNRSFYVCMNDRSNIRVLQVKVIDNGANPVKQFGQLGYSLKLNKGRLYAKNGVATTFEGWALTTSSEYKVYNNSNLATTSANSFTIASPVIMHVERSGGKYYVYQDPEDKGTLYTANADVELNATGTWYISSETSGSAASFTKIEFLAPKCEKPVFGTIEDLGLCEEDPYTAIDATATVSDGGTVTYQWYNEDDSAIEGAINAKFTPSADGKYYVIATNSLADHADNFTKSELITVQHVSGTEITSAPVSVRDDAGETATLTVVAAGKNLSYKWYTCDEDGSNAVLISGAESDSYSVTITADMAQFFMVEVSGDCGAPVSAIAKVEEWKELAQVDVSENTTWNMANSADAAINLKSLDPSRQDEHLLLANVKGVNNNETFNAQALMFEGQHIGRTSNGVKHIAGRYLQFNVTKPGIVNVTFASNGGDQRTIRINGNKCSETTNDGAYISFSAVVNPGSVEIMGMQGDEENKYVRISKIEFMKVDYTRDVTVGRLGTICLPNGGKMYGADLYEVAYFDASAKKIFFDEILSGEMEAGVPYVFLPNGKLDKLAVAYTDEVGASAGNKNGLYGSYTQEALGTDGSNYILLNNQYCRVVEANTYVGAYRAYLKIGVAGGVPTNAVAPAPGRRRISMGVQNEQVATNIENVQGDEVQSTKVLINGQLFILRGEKMYDATGCLVK